MHCQSLHLRARSGSLKGSEIDMEPVKHSRSGTEEVYQDPSFRFGESYTPAEELCTLCQVPLRLTSVLMASSAGRR